MKGFLVLLLLLLCSLTPLAGPPFVTDDPEPVDYQHWEFYVASQHVETSDGWSGTAPHVELNYGAITNLQLHLIAPIAYDTPRERPSHSGLATPRSAQSTGSSRKGNICRKLEFFRCWKFPPAANQLGLAVAMCKRFYLYGSRRVGAKRIANGPLTEAAVMTSIRVRAIATGLS
jgi:hypothetical protein